MTEEILRARLDVEIFGYASMQSLHEYIVDHAASTSGQNVKEGSWQYRHGMIEQEYEAAYILAERRIMSAPRLQMRSIAAMSIDSSLFYCVTSCRHSDKAIIL